MNDDIASQKYQLAEAEAAKAGWSFAAALSRLIEQYAAMSPGCPPPFEKEALTQARLRAHEAMLWLDTAKSYGNALRGEEPCAKLLQPSINEGTAEFERRRSIMLAGYNNQKSVLSQLGSLEQATWWAGRCAADPQQQHPYVSREEGGAFYGLHGVWGPDVLVFRAEMKRLGGLPDTE